MSRPNKVWFRKDVGWWMVTLGGKKIRLAEGRQNKKIAEQKYHELAAVRAQAPESPTARVADVIEAFLAWSKLHRSDETNRNYLWFGQAFSEHSGDLVASELKPIHLTRWIDAEAWGQTTQRNARRSIYRAFSWACEEGILSRNPLNGMRCPRARARARILTDAEYRALLKNSDGDFKVLLFALKETGCRPKEARVLKWEHVQADRWILPEHKTAYKVAKPRVIYLTASMQMLMNHLRRRSTSEHVFLNARAKPWTRNAIRLRIMRLKKKLDLATDLCAYLFRHAFATNALLNGVDCASVAELLGHADVTMVAKVYGHLAGQHEHLQTAVQRATRPLASAKPRRGEPHQGA